MISSSSIIYVEHCSYRDLKTALKQFLQSYAKDLKKDYTFKLHKNGRGKHILEVDSRVTNFLFFYLLNYLSYPDYITYNPVVFGFTTAENVNLFESKDLGNRLKVFLCDDQNDFDNVCVLTEDYDLFKIDFGGKKEKLKGVSIFFEPEFPSESITASETIAIPEPIKDQGLLFLNHKRFVKRFFILSLTYLLVLLISIHRVDSEVHNDYFVFLMVLPYGWLFFEHDYLFKRRHYLKMLLFSIVILLIGFYAFHYKLVKDPLFVLVVLTAPLLFLILQKLLSVIYIFVFNKKPDMLDDTLTSKFAYQIPVLLIPMLSSIYLYDVYEYLLT